MKNKLFKLGTIILTGLSLSLFSRCIPFETLDVYYVDYYTNSSNHEVTIEMIYLEDLDSVAVKTVNIPPGEEREGLYGEEVSGFPGGDTPVLGHIKRISRFESINLSVNDTVVREWKPLKEDEMNTNSPFNSDSWVVELYDSIIEGIHGRITFTITNADIER